MKVRSRSQVCLHAFVEHPLEGLLGLRACPLMVMAIVSRKPEFRAQSTMEESENEAEVLRPLG